MCPKHQAEASATECDYCKMVLQLSEVSTQRARAVELLAGYEARAVLAERLNDERIKAIEAFKCSAKVEECTARHFGYNLAIDDVLEILREPLKRIDEPCPECHVRAFHGENCSRR